MIRTNKGLKQWQFWYRDYKAEKTFEQKKTYCKTKKTPSLVYFSCNCFGRKKLNTETFLQRIRGAKIQQLITVKYIADEKNEEFLKYLKKGLRVSYVNVRMKSFLLFD